MVCFRLHLWIFAALLLLAGCAHRPPAAAHSPSPSVQLTSALAALDPSVDIHDAAVLATVAMQTSSGLAVSYRVRPPAWLHNVFVNNGWRQRGLCWHWAEDLQARLAQERFATLEVHRVIARRGTRREHSGLVVTARGQSVTNGIILDAWRECGHLVWAPLAKDKYPWKELTNDE